jgi:hypothetical protein
MRTMLVAMVVLASRTGAACAELPTPGAFTVWEKEGSMGLTVTPMQELMRLAQTGEGLSWYVGLTPHRAVAGNPPQLTTLVRN